MKTNTKKIFEIIRFYSLTEINKYIQDGHEYPTYHAWCYDILAANKYNINCIDYKNTRINIMGKKLRIVNLQQQINCLRLSEKDDIVFAPFIRDIFVLAILKILKIYKTPIIAISHTALVPYQKNILKRFKLLLIRNIYLSGVDKILFLNQRMYDFSNNYKSLNERHSYIQNWGVDFLFFNSYSINQLYIPKNDFVLSLGGTNRDYKILIEAFKNINIKLKIIPKSPSNIPHDIEITHNIEIGSSIPDLYSYGPIREEYYNCLAVAIPLIRELDYYPTGSTILFEAMSMGKAVITTRNKAYPFDVEEEKIGLNVDYGDVDGWVKAVNFLITHPDEAKEMGNRGRELAKERYNYQNFSKQIINEIETIHAKKL